MFEFCCFTYSLTANKYTRRYYSCTQITRKSKFVGNRCIESEYIKFVRNLKEMRKRLNRKWGQTTALAVE